MSEQLLLSNIRNVLAQLEETIIFELIERAQFKRNDIIYRPGAFGPALGGKSLVGFHLFEIEKVHARIRRYTSPDEHPFFSGLPEPILPLLQYGENPLRPNSVNINNRIRPVYEKEIVPYICKPGDDKQYGSSSMCDVTCLQALSKRIHYGKFAAESKFRSDPEAFRVLCADGDREGLMKLITDPEVEARVLERISLKAETYCRELSGEGGNPKIDPEIVVDIYRQWIIPLNKEVQLAYLINT
ncbi:MAG: chorismate mutase [Candidatus Euphemobacter frigidus]|nr:chorismate mutase [Candidatus Euphemobacter frigidus]MDP8276457.1 chorismate mutase [Candidatus Euphemobacter frigidus]